MLVFVHTTRLFVGRIVARGLELFSLLRDTLIEARQDQIRLKAELSRRRYRPSSKNAGEGPIVHSVASGENI